MERKKPIQFPTQRVTPVEEQSNIDPDLLQEGEGIVMQFSKKPITEPFSNKPDSVNVPNNVGRRETLPDLIRELSEKLWVDAAEKGDEAAKAEAASILTDQFGPIRAGKIIERLSIANKAKQKQDLDKGKTNPESSSPFRIIK